MRVVTITMGPIVIDCRDSGAFLSGLRQLGDNRTADPESADTTPEAKSETPSTATHEDGPFQLDEHWSDIPSDSYDPYNPWDQPFGLFDFS